MTVVAIDGPAGAGKSTVARRVAELAGLPFLDTGAMYRCIALAVLEQGLDVHDQVAVGRVAATVEIAVEGDLAFLDGRDVSDLIRAAEISSVVSIIATHSNVREALRNQQRKWVEQHGGGVVEGRDIGTVVFPEADVKVFLTATPSERARRRVQQSGGDIDAIAKNIEERDRLDSTRADSPLRRDEAAVVIDSSGEGIEAVASQIVALLDGARKRN